MNLTSLNKQTYDTLANEYESRVPSLTPVTSEAMDYFTSYLPSNGTVLDLGCAVGIALKNLHERGFKTTGIEIAPQMVAFARKRNPHSKIIVGDFETASFNAQFDGILAFAFIHLFPKQKIPALFQKIRQLLTPTGIALISTTESPESKEGLFEKGDFNRGEKRFRKYWTEHELRQALLDAHFKIVALKKFADPYGKIWMDFIVSA